MINRNKIKELLKIEVEKAGSVRAAASRMKINPTSVQNYIDEITEPRGKTLDKIITYFRKPISFFHDDTGEKPIPPQHIQEIQEPYAITTLSKDDKYRIIAEVGEILDSGNGDIIDALIKNVREFRMAVDTKNKLNSCLDRIDAMQTQINKLNQRINGLTAPPTGADASAASSGKGET